MANAENRTTTLTGLLKETYADRLRWLMPKMTKLQRDISFVARDKRPGNDYHQPVVLRHEHGFTYSKPAAGAFALQGYLAGQIQDATITGFQIMLQSVLDYESAARASTGGRRAFVQSAGYMVENMIQSFRKRLEIDLFYGQSGLAIVSAANNTTDVITIDDATWASGIWAGQEGAHIEIFDTALANQRTSDVYEISAVDIANKTITVTDSAGAAVAVSTVVDTDVIFFEGQYTVSDTTHHSNVGLHKILSTAAADTLFGISTDNSLWLANTFDAGTATLTFAKVSDAVALAVGKGLDEDLTLYVAPNTWSDLLTEQTALRMYDQSYGSARLDQGAEAIRFWSQNGEIEIKPSIYVKEGFAYLVSLPSFMRVGATDISFRHPDRGDEYFRELSTNAGYELRAYSNQAIFCEAVGRQVFINNIVT